MRQRHIYRFNKEPIYRGDRSCEYQSKTGWYGFGGTRPPPGRAVGSAIRSVGTGSYEPVHRSGSGASGRQFLVDYRRQSTIANLAQFIR